MSRSHGRELSAQLKEICILPIFNTYYVILCVIFALFLVQNFKTKVLTAPKNLLLECLSTGRLNNSLFGQLFFKN